MTKARNPKQVELDLYAARRRWRRGPFKTWTLGPHTIAVSASGKYLIVARKTGGTREVGTLDELDQIVRGGSRVG